MIRSPKTMAATLLAGAAAPILLSFFLSGVQVLEVMRGVMLSISLGIAVTWSPTVHAAVYSYSPEEDALNVGVFLTAVGTALWALWYLIWKALGSPDLWWDEYLLCAIAYLTICGGTLTLISARTVQRGRLPPKYWVIFGLLVGGGMGLALGVLSLASFELR